MKKRGVTEEIRLFTSESSIFSKLHVMNWLGLGSDALHPIPCNEKGQISVPELEKKIRETLQQGIKVAGIILNHGSIDSFAFDDTKKIVQLRNSLVQEFRLGKTSYN
jgi:glutamate/tyrosine decarboxylase-like PLP-dependent enzyme